MASIEELTESVSEANKELLELQQSLELESEKIFRLGQEALDTSKKIKVQVEGFHRIKLDEHAGASRHALDQFPPFFKRIWEQNDWLNYEHNIHATVPFITIGEIKEASSGQSFSVPAMIPFIGENKTVVIPCDQSDKTQKLEIFQSLIERVAVMLPHACRFTLLDPERLNASFPIQKSLPFVRTVDDFELSRTLQDIVSDISRINQEYLNNQIDSFEKLGDQIRSSERFECVFAANFPHDYNRRSIELLQKISKTGPQAGKYLFIHHDSSAELPGDLCIEDFSNCFFVDEKRLHKNNWGVSTQFQWAAPLTNELLPVVFDGLRDAKPVEHNLAFSEITPTAPETWWKSNADQEIRVPLGGSGSSQPLDLWFGTALDGRQCSHGMLGAMTGSGKSNLYHVFICGLISRYSPEEVGLYLIDGKQGVEFQAYRNIPHAKVVSLHTTPLLARSVLDELVQIMERRNEIFQRHSVVDLKGYRALGSPEGKLPRLLLMVDEYQTLFESDKDGVGSKLMLSIASQGRSAGVHMFVGSQRFSAPNMLNQSSIFGNMHLRIAMKMTDSDVAALTEFGKLGKARIKGCDAAGKVVVNDAAGDDGSNHSGKVAYLGDDERSVFITKVIEEYKNRFPEKVKNKAVLFNGKAQPILNENPQFIHLIEKHKNRPTADQWQTFAQTPEHQSGFGEPEWYRGEVPSVFWLGQEFNIHGQCKVVLRRRQEENVLIVGESSEARLGLLSAALACTSVNHVSTEACSYVIDRSVAGSPWNGVLNKVCGQLTKSNGSNCHFGSENQDFAQYLADITEQLQQRTQLPENEILHLPTIYFFIFDAQRISGLEKIAGRHGIKESSELGKLLENILQKGPELGIHTFLSVNGVRPLQQFIDNNTLTLFRHKIALQMSEEESFSLLRSRHAASLQENGKKPIMAMYANAATGIELRFKPYCYIEQIQTEFFASVDDFLDKTASWLQSQS